MISSSSSGYMHTNDIANMSPHGYVWAEPGLLNRCILRSRGRVG